MASIKAIFWDFEGVVLYPNKGSFAATLAKRLGTPISDVDKAMQSEMVLKWDIDEIDDITFYTYLLNAIQQPLDKISIIQHCVSEDFYIDQTILEIIKTYRKSYTCVLLTNFPKHIHDFIKSDWNIESAFDHLIASCDVKVVKPNPAIYQLALERADCKPNECVFLDDREANVEAAEALGIHGILFKNREQGISDLEKLLEG